MPYLCEIRLWIKERKGLDTSRGNERGTSYKRKEGRKDEAFFTTIQSQSHKKNSPKIDNAK
jgi:hypothetical protein